MMKYSICLFVAVLSLAANYDAHAGFFSSLRDRALGQSQNQAPQQQVQPAIPGPAEQGGAVPQQTPDPEKIKAGARKLERELSWERVPRDLFRRYAGKWVGNFWVYSPLGRKEQVQQVGIEYTPQSDGSMMMKTISFDKVSKTWVVEETARYSVEGDKVIVDIQRPTGKTARQMGHYNDGQLFLEAQISDGAEHFRERIDGKRLLIDGYGIYGSPKDKDRHVFIGRFVRQ